MTTQPIVAWCEIPVSDMQKAMAFYDTVFGYQMKMDESGPNPIAFLGGRMDDCGGHLYPGKPAQGGTGPTIHLHVPDNLEAAMKRCQQAGGRVLSEPVTIPPGRFAYVLDPDGNSIGLFEAKG